MLPDHLFNLLVGICLGVIIGVWVYPILYLLATGDFPGAHMFYGLQEDSWLVTSLLSIR